MLRRPSRIYSYNKYVVVKQFTIGFFDSGVGGLSVLRQVAQSLGESRESLRYLYVGDTARFPYGDRSPAEIRQFVAQITSWLSAKGADAIVIACHTAGCAAADIAAACTNIPVYDLSRSVVELASSGNQKTVILATESTVKSGVLINAIKPRNPDVYQISCPDLAPIVEKDLAGTKTAEAALKKYVDMIVEMKAQQVVLACTHFSFLSAQLASMLATNVPVLDPAVRLSKYLAISGQAQPQDKFPRVVGSASYEFFTTGEIEPFQKAIERYAGISNSTVSGITIDELVAAGSSCDPTLKALA